MSFCKVIFIQETTDTENNKYRCILIGILLNDPNYSIILRCKSSIKIMIAFRSSSKTHNSSSITADSNSNSGYVDETATASLDSCVSCIEGDINPKWNKDRD
jgi:hypothetical protein